MTITEEMSMKPFSILICLVLVLYATITATAVSISDGAIDSNRASVERPEGQKSALTTIQPSDSESGLNSLQMAQYTTTPKEESVFTLSAGGG
jgi:hypothetical protein